jgi:hypothetical protein
VAFDFSALVILDGGRNLVEEKARRCCRRALAGIVRWTEDNRGLAGRRDDGEWQIKIARGGAGVGEGSRAGSAS